MAIFPTCNYEGILKCMVRNVFKAREVCRKPGIVAMHNTTTANLLPLQVRLQEELGLAGLPVFPSFSRAAAMMKVFWSTRTGRSPGGPEKSKHFGG